MNDLDPYVCIFDDCDAPDELYGHSQTWLKHMREHAMRWRCTSKSHEMFTCTTREEYLSHMRIAHAAKFTDPQLRVLADKNSRVSGPLFRSCPLCGADEATGSMEDHVVGHMRLLALKSLPSFEDNTGDFETSDAGSETTWGPKNRSTIENNSGRESNLSFQDDGWTNFEFAFNERTSWASKFEPWGGFRNYISNFPRGATLDTDEIVEAKLQLARHGILRPSRSNAIHHSIDLAKVLIAPDTVRFNPRVDPSIEFIELSILNEVPEKSWVQFEWGFIPMYETQADPNDDPVLRAFIGSAQSPGPRPLITMDPDCAICLAPASLACECEAKALQVAIGQAEEKIMSTTYNRIRSLVRQRAQESVMRKISQVKSEGSHCASLATQTLAADEILKEDSGQPCDRESAAPRDRLERGDGKVLDAQAVVTSKEANPERHEGTSEYWETARDQLAEALDYYFSLVEVGLPKDEDPAVREPPLPYWPIRDGRPVVTRKEGIFGRKERGSDEGNYDLDSANSETSDSEGGDGSNHQGVVFSRNTIKAKFEEEYEADASDN